MAAGIPRYRSVGGPAILSAGFRPFFLAAALWSAIGVPLWLLLLEGTAELPSALPASTWHAHEMVFGFGAATVAGFLLTAIPNWTGRMPLQNGPLAALVALWLAGRTAVMVSSVVGPVAAALDLAFPLVFFGVVAREIIAGRNWRNAPMLVALGLLLGANLLVHLEALDVAATAAIGNRLGIAFLLMLISLVGGRIIPSFTGNWLAKHRRGTAMPAPFGRFDAGVLAATGAALALWAVDPDLPMVPWLALLAGVAALARLARWRGIAIMRDPLLAVLHLGYAWVGVGFLLLAGSGFGGALPPIAAMHALTAGAIGTMPLAVMTRASLGHTGRPLVAGPLTTAIYALVTAAAVLRVAAPLLPLDYALALWLAGAAWSGAFGLFAFAYGRILMAPRAATDKVRPI
jgi:uncharacterized protein involved in response to NO